MDTDLKSLSDLLDEKLQPIRDDLAIVKKDFGELKQDVSTLKSDVAGLKKDMAYVKRNLDDLMEIVSEEIVPKMVSREEHNVLEQRVTILEHHGN